jgi:protein involved in polysaccharide export with SLBB domain
MKLEWHIVFAAAVAFALCSGCKSTGESTLGEGDATPSTAATSTRQNTGSKTVTLSPGDVIKLSFQGAAELNQTQKIKADGKVNLPLIGEVMAAGKTVLDFQTELVALYKPQLRNSDVLVTLESGVVNVFVTGQVGKPGRFAFDRPTTVLQAIMEAGGANEFGNLARVRLIRTTGGRQAAQVLNLKSALKGESSQVEYVKDGDMIIVPQKFF